MLAQTSPQGRRASTGPSWAVQWAYVSRVGHDAVMMRPVVVPAQRSSSRTSKARAVAGAPSDVAARKVLVSSWLGLTVGSEWSG